MTAHAPKPDLALSIGLTGHRLNDPKKPEQGNPENIRALDKDVLRNRIGALLGDMSAHISSLHKNIAWAFSDAPPKLGFLSCLAEGADRAGAHAALEASWSLGAILPLDEGEYRRDFDTDASKDDFDDLLMKAGRGAATVADAEVLTLPGDKSERDRAYELAGHVLLDHISLLIAVWDGKAGAGRGGTEEVVAEAVRRQIPVIWINAEDPNAPPSLHWSKLEWPPVHSRHFHDLPCRLIDEEIDPSEKEEKAKPPLHHVLEKIIAPPATESKSLEEFYDEKEPGVNWRIEWPVLQAMFAPRDKKQIPVDADTNGSSSQSGPSDGDDTETESFHPKLASAFTAADGLANISANCFRSTIVSNFLLAGLAVFVVALSVLLKDGLHLVDKKWPFVLIEIGLIALLWCNFVHGKGRQYHRRWIEYREVAERLRLIHILRRFGTRLVTETGAPISWPFWYARAVSRDAGLPSINLAKEGLEDKRQALLALLDDQIGYHNRTSRRMHALEHRLETVGLALFVATLVAVTAYFVLEAILGVDFSKAYKPVPYIVTAVAAGFPVLATAFYGIRVIIDFEGIARRSSGMSAELQTLGKALKRDVADPEKRNDLMLLQTRGRQAANIMLGDLDGWRTSAQGRRLQLTA
ncbi:hypothetical protein AB1P65_09975 [Roseibium alexandrii]